MCPVKKFLDRLPTPARYRQIIRRVLGLLWSIHKTGLDGSQEVCSRDRLLGDVSKSVIIRRPGPERDD